MGKTSIEWCTDTWNPTRGCSRVSEGCRNCYAEKIASRFSYVKEQDRGYGQAPDIIDVGAFNGFADEKGWTGHVALIEEKLEEPLRWREPRRIFVNSMSDLFHEELSDEAIDRVFAVMALCPQHTFQVLTKRAERMHEYFRAKCGHFVAEHKPGYSVSRILPIDNVDLGVSVENKATLNRIEWLRKVPAAVRFLSIEPLLEDLGFLDFAGIHQVIVGGESGPKARPMHPDWARGVRDQCQAAGVAFFFKQWGEFGPTYTRNGYLPASHREPDSAYSWGGGEYSPRLGKKVAGRLLDGREWNELPNNQEAR